MGGLEGSLKDVGARLASCHAELAHVTAGERAARAVLEASQGASRRARAAAAVADERASAEVSELQLRLRASESRVLKAAELLEKKVDRSDLTTLQASYKKTVASLLETEQSNRKLIGDLAKMKIRMIRSSDDGRDSPSQWG